MTDHGGPDLDAAVGDEEVVIDRIVTIPNAITLVRLLFLPVFVWLLFGRDNREAAGWMLVTIASTDWVDGQLARRLGQVSTVGQILDPVVDRLWFFVAAGCILADGSVPVWFAVAVLAREIVVALGTLAIAAMGAARVAVTWAGKKATFFLMGALPSFLVGASDASYNGFFDVVAWVVGIPGLILSYFAAAQYVPLAVRALREGRVSQQ